MAVAAVDVVGYLPGPAAKGNTDAADVLGAGEALAYGVGSAVAVADVRRMKLATVLAGGHRGAAVTAVAWSPHHHARDLRGPTAGLRLASGDAEGRVVVWDVASGGVTVALDDALTAALGRRPDGVTLGHRSGAVAALAWVTADPALLGIAVSHGTFLIWDTAGGSIIWKKEVSAADGLKSLAVDPSDRRHLCLCGGKGALTVLKLTNPARDRVQQQQFRVDMGAGGSDKPGAAPQQEVSCTFSRTPDLLFVLLPREVAVFDLELQAPAASTKLPGGRPAFRAVLGAFGHASAGGALLSTGLDLLYCLHQDGSLSVWRRHGTGLTYTALAWHKLIPPPSRASGSAAASIISAAATVWRPQQGTHSSTATTSGKENRGVAASSGGMILKRRFGSRDDESANISTQSRVQQLNGGSSDSRRDAAAAQVADLGRPELLVMLVTSAGQLQRWSAPLTEADTSADAGTSSSAAPQPLLQPALQGMLGNLPAAVTTFAACPVPVGVAGDRGSGSGSGGDAAAVLAVVTAAGTLEIATLRRGALSPLSATVTLSLAMHKDVVRGVRWLGATPRVVTFSSEKAGAGFRNSLLLTDVRARCSTPFREVGVETAPMLGVRASPSGRYILVLLRAAPSEVWTVGGGEAPRRLRVLDLPFSAVEWALPGDAPQLAPEGLPPDRWALFARSPLARERSMTGYLGEDMETPTAAGADATSTADQNATAVELPIERLAFALGDGTGRIGVLAVQGRKVTDTKPRRPTAGIMDGGDVASTAVAAWGTLVVFGDSEGKLYRWDTSSGRTTAIATGQGAVRRMHFAPPASAALPFNPMPGGATEARLAVLFAGGAFGVWELDSRLDLRQGPVTVATAARMGRVTDIAWAPLPAPVGGGAVLLAATDDGGVAVLDACQAADAAPRRLRGIGLKAAVGGGWPLPAGGLAAPPPLGSAALLPPAWGLLLRLMIQQGVPSSTLEVLASAASSAAASVADLEAAEAALWAALPPGCRGAWEAARHATASQGAVVGRRASEPHFTPHSSLGHLSSVDSLAVGGNGMPKRAGSGALRIRTDSRRASELLPGDGEAGPSLADVISVLATARGGSPLLASEVAAANAAAASTNPAAARAELAARVLGKEEEAQFWQQLPATLAAARDARHSAADGSSSNQPASSSSRRPLWEPQVLLAEARERVSWHEAMDSGAAPSDRQQERRMVEYVSLGDYHSAVGFLLASPPDRSARYYRDALCTLALAHAAAAVPDSKQSASSPAAAESSIETSALVRQETPSAAIPQPPPASSLLWQAAKVVAANAASVGDALLGVPLLCSSGLVAEAAAVLQDAGLWRYAATLAAGSLPDSAQAAVLDRWSTHIAQAEGHIWRAAALLVAGGDFDGTAALFTAAQLPDCASAFANVLSDAGIAALQQSEAVETNMRLYAIELLQAV